MRNILILATLIAAPAGAQTAPQGSAPTKPAASQEIVVIGRLGASKRALDECIARHCPPAEDIRASIRHAENQFLNGDYQGAWATLDRAKGRTRGRRNEVAAEYADLMRATALITRNLGEDHAYRTSALQARAVLADNRPPGDPLLLAVSLEVGDMYLRTHHVESAENIYRQIQARARAEGAFTTEAAALLRLVSLYVAEAMGSELAHSYLGKAKAVAAEIAARPEPVFRRFDPVARMMVARLAAQLGDSTGLDAAIEAYRSQVGPLVPVVAWAQPPRLDQARMGAPNDVTSPGSRDSAASDYIPMTRAENRRPGQDFDDQWIDVSFWVRPNGAVEDVAIIRRSKRLSGGWEVPVLRSVSTRRYVPLALSATDPGLLRIERYTLTAPYEKVTGSIIPGRSPMAGRLEVVDLSPVAAH